MPPLRRLAPLLAAGAAAAGIGVLQPGAETGACAQGGDAVVARADCGAAAAQTPEACAATTQSFVAVAARPRGRRVRFTFTRRVDRPVRIDVFQVAAGRRVIGQRLVARFAGRTEAVRWNGRAQRGRPRVRDGVLFARFAIRDERGRLDERRIALRRAGGRFRLRPPFYRRRSCTSLTAFKLERPVFGGPRNRALGIAFRLARAGVVRVEVRRGGRVVRRFRAATRRARVTHRLRLPSEGLRRGTYEVRLRYAGGPGALAAALFAQRL